MINKDIIEAFVMIAREKNIDRANLGSIIEELFMSMIHKKFGEERDNFSVIVNMEKGEIEIKEGIINVNESGQVSVNGVITDSLKLVRFRNQDKLQKLGQGFFAPIEANNLAIVSDEIKIKQGMLEDSNVNSMLEMTRMINATRAYESVHKALSRVDKLNETAISLVKG